MKEVGLEYPKEYILQARNEGKLLGLGLELTSKCNLKCVYCYTCTGKPPLENELTYEEIINIIEQALPLGLRKVGIVGRGEPLLDLRLPKLVSFSFQKGLRVTVYTNGTLINKSLADLFFSTETSLVISLNSLRAEVNDYLRGVNGTLKKTLAGIKMLKDVGYPDRKHKVIIESVVTRYNMNDLPTLWKWAREQGFIPDIERLTLTFCGRAGHDIHVSPRKLFNLFKTLRKIDESEFGLTWDVQPPHAGFYCTRHFYGCLINAWGYVQPCSGLAIHIANVRRKRLESILRHPIIRNLRHIDRTIKGPCRTCIYHEKNLCYGCRAQAYYLTGDYLASDPECWYIQCRK